jgi:hypothetical protein
MAYQFSPVANFQLGFMAQTIGDQTRPYLQTALVYNPDLRNRKKR